MSSHPPPALWMTVGAVAIGGALGATARAMLLFPVSGAVAAAVATMGVNILGSLLLGAIVGWLDERRPLLRAMLGTGAMGGFTTYSAFAVQTVQNAGSAPWATLGIVFGSVLAGLLAAAVGLFIGRRIADVPGEVEDPREAE